MPFLAWCQLWHFPDLTPSHIWHYPSGNRKRQPGHSRKEAPTGADTDPKADASKIALRHSGQYAGGFMPNPASIAGVIRERLRELGCPWCKGPIGETEPVTEVCMRLVHDSPCLIEFDTFTHSEHDPDSLTSHLKTSIALTINDDEPVLWGEWTGREPDDKYVTEEVRWGDLSSYERHTVERRPDGRLVGGYGL